MRGEPIDVVNKELREVHRLIAADPILSDVCRMSIITFSTDVRIVIPMSKLSHVETFPAIVAKGQTRLGVLFRGLGEVIRSDVERLKSESRSVLRPILFFITDGRPTDAWKRSFEAFVDRNSNTYAPNVIAFGVGDANEEVILRIGLQRALMANKTESVPAALRAVIKSMMQSIVASARATDMTLRLPESNDVLRIIERT